MEQTQRKNIMGFRMKTTDELIKIAGAGGGFVLEAGRRSTDELVRIATAAKWSGATVIFMNVAMRKTDDLAKIAASAKGHVIFGS
jgi:hypothetical protein